MCEGHVGPGHLAERPEAPAGCPPRRSHHRWTWVSSSPWRRSVHAGVGERAERRFHLRHKKESPLQGSAGANAHPSSCMGPLGVPRGTDWSPKKGVGATGMGRQRECR